MLFLHMLEENYDSLHSLLNKDTQDAHIGLFRTGMLETNQILFQLSLSLFLTYILNIRAIV
jgi:hypothetical protein